MERLNHLHGSHFSQLYYCRTREVITSISISNVWHGFIFDLNLQSNSRYISRCVLIEFTSPCLNVSLLEYTKFSDLLDRALNAVAFAIGLGQRFIEAGIYEMDKDILPELKEVMGDLVLPRVLPSYAILTWFTLEVSIRK